MVIMEDGDRNKVIRAVNNALRNCGYPNWTMTKVTDPPQSNDRSDREKGKTICCVIQAYIRGLSEELHRILKDNGCCNSSKLGNI